MQMVLAGKSGLVPFAGCRGLEVNAVTRMGVLTPCPSEGRLLASFSTESGTCRSPPCPGP